MSHLGAGRPAQPARPGWAWRPAPSCLPAVAGRPKCGFGGKRKESDPPGAAGRANLWEGALPCPDAAGTVPHSPGRSRLSPDTRSGSEHLTGSRRRLGARGAALARSPHSGGREVPAPWAERSELPWPQEPPCPARQRPLAAASGAPNPAPGPPSLTCPPRRPRSGSERSSRRQYPAPPTARRDPAPAGPRPPRREPAPLAHWRLARAGPSPLAVPLPSFPFPTFPRWGTQLYADCSARSPELEAPPVPHVEGTVSR
ncbi:hypothetical protein P7K49_017133 [Saguinus oedipus]|uniref:Basic proline-rich protein-like n=1 Tax=Saguinus oedipus TaxID=9490 RepID=A0ABQ9V1N9_SAGOE|nr:hypothetical protein P7K49_017133 [Saguinus oedipus]